MSDVFWQALIGAVATVVIAWMQQRTRAAVRSTAAHADRRAASVEKTLEANTAATSDKLDGIARTGDTVHTLVNSNMAAQMRIASLALRRVAELTGHPDDLRAADLAEKLYKDHETRQLALDENSIPLPNTPGGMPPVF